MMRPDLPDGRLEDELRAAFSGATDDLAPTRDPWARTMGAVARSRTRRRAGALAAVAVAALTVVGTVLPIRGTPPDPANPEPVPTVTSTDVTTWPTRGNLAGRADLLAQVRADGRSGSVVSVPFLGEVEGLGVALVVAWGTDENGGAVRYLAALWGRVSQPVSGWDRSHIPFEDEQSGSFPVPVLTAVLRARDDTVRVVVVTVTDGVRAAFSQRPQIDPQGSASRRFTAVRLRDGVGTAVSRGTMSSATLRLQWGDAPPVIRDPQLMNWQVPASPEPIGGSVAASCQGARFANLRLNLDNIGRNAASAAGRAPDDIAQLRAVGCRLVGDHAVMFTSVGLTDGTALQTVQEGVGQGNPDAFPGAEVYPVPRGREVTFPRHHRPTWVGDRDRVVDRTVLFCAPGGATAELVRRFADGATTVLAKAQLGKDGIGVATALHRIDATTGGSVQLSVVVRNGAGQEIETAPVGGDDPMGRQLDGPVDGA